LCARACVVAFVAVLAILLSGAGCTGGRKDASLAADYTDLVTRVDDAVASVNAKLDASRPVADVRSVLAARRTLSGAALGADAAGRAVQVQGILLRSGKPMAIVNGEVVGVGEEVGPYKVLAIEGREVKLQDRQGSVSAFSVYEDLRRYE
jgi:hypothetical protein